MSSPQNCTVAKPRSQNFFRVRPLLRRGIMYRRIVPGLVCGPQGDRGGHAGAGSRVRHRRHQLAQTAPSNSRLGVSRRTILRAARNPRSVAAMGRWPGIAVRPCGPQEAGRPRQSAGGRREPAQERRVGQFQPMSQGRALACAAAASGRGPPAAGRGTSTAQGSRRMDSMAGATRRGPGKAIMAIEGRRGKADRLNGPASIAGGPCPLEAARPFLTREPRALPRACVRCGFAGQRGIFTVDPAKRRTIQPACRPRLEPAWRPGSAADRTAFTGRMGAARSRGRLGALPKRPVASPSARSFP